MIIPKVLKPILLYGIILYFKNASFKVAKENDVVILAVKPQHVPKVTSEIAPIFRRDHLLISIALGNPIQSSFLKMP
jgi:pyrroline-5-carboxylate reductase